MVRNDIVCEGLEARLALLSQQNTVSVDEWRDLLREAEELCPDQPLGLQIGSEVQVGHAGVLGYLLLNSHNIADALETYLLCERHFYGVNFAELTRGDSGWMLTWPDQVGKDNALFVQVGMTALVTFLRQRFPGGCGLLSVSLTGDAPDNIGPFEQFFGCPVVFNSEYPGVTFDGDAIQRSSPGGLPEDYRAMRRQQQTAFYSVTGADDPFLKGLQSVLLKSIPEGGATLPKVARGLNMSPRTLQRRLFGYSLSYQALIDSVREQLARRYLSRTNLMLSEIPLLLGYSDQSAFNRAFRLWTGMTPGRYRQRERTGMKADTDSGSL